MQQKLLDGALGGSDRDGATGSVSLTDWSNVRRRRQVVVTVAGGTADVVVKGGVSPDRLGILHSATGTSSVAFEGDGGPWPYLEVAWSSNDGTIAIDASLAD